MSTPNVSDAQSSAKTARSPGNLFDNKALSDVQIKLRDDQRIFGHKQILAQKSEWFYRAFNGDFPVAASGEICLDDDDDDPEAICAMVRHIYDLDQTVYLSTFKPDLMFHVNVFAAADKYDVPSLRVLVVSKFTQLMRQQWRTSQGEFCTVIQRLCGPDAVSFADASLRRAATEVCTESMLTLIKLDTFVDTLEDCGPFAARLLATFLKDKRVIHSLRCQKCRSTSECALRSDLKNRCFTCGNSPSTNTFGVAEKLQSYTIMEL